MNVRLNRRRSRFYRAGLAVALVVGLGLTAACDTAEERAEAHYQTGLSLLQTGDVDRALVEFRNVFQLNGDHLGARLAFARAQRERGFFKEAYGQYLRVVEQEPDNLEGRRALAEMALDARDWAEAERHATKAIALAPGDIRVQSIDNAVAYFHAVQDMNVESQQAAILKAQALVQQDESLHNSREIVLDDLFRKQDWYAALDVIDEGLRIDPDNGRLYQMRLAVLQQVGDLDAIDKQLRDLMARYPEDRNEHKQTLVRFLLSQEKRDEAEAFLRQDADREGAETADKIELLDFLLQVRGRETALAEIENQIAAGGPDLRAFRAMRAKLNFELGNEEAGLTEMQALVDGAERNDQTRSLEVDLARMLFRQDNSVGARALIEQVLSEDGSQPDAVKLKANWLINEDETGDAIVLLRAALNQSPQDPVLMSLLASAYEREGNRELMGEMLALAVQASGQAARESLRYSGFLFNDGKLTAAEGVLIDSLRVNPGNISLLAMLGKIYTEMEDWSRVESVIRDLKRLDDPKAELPAQALTAQKLTRQNRTEELTALLEEMTDDEVLGRDAEIALIRARLAADGPQAAETYLDGLLAENPDDPALRFLKAGFLMEAAKVAEAEAIFRDLLKQDAQQPAVWIALYRLKAQTEDEKGAKTVLADALAALPENGDLLWARAGELERAGDVEGSIAIYERMYENNSVSPIIANNLASLLSSHRSDDASLERAYTVARRLRNTDVPAFQDTYGWITFRRGNHKDSLSYLQAAALGLPNDVTVQYHLAANLAALERNDEALQQFRKVAEMIDPANPPEFADEVTGEISRLEKAATAQ